MIVVRTPFRLPFGGGGTDLPAYYRKYGGSLVTAAVNKYMFVSVNQPALIERIKINYSKVENVSLDEVPLIHHDVVRETLTYLKIRRSIEITSTADVGAGTGMGSSSSYTVGLLNGLNTMLRRYLSLQELAEEACMIEMELARKPVGKQDAYAAAFGGIIHMEIAPGGAVHVTPLTLENETIYELENRLMMFYTNIQRDANEILSEQSRKVDIDDNAATESMHRIKQIGLEIKTALLAGDISLFGRLMHQHWLEKKRVSGKMSNPFIDQCYDTAMANGALGGKLMGAGGGGFLLFCCEAPMRRQLRAALEAHGLRYMNFKFDWNGSKILVNV